MSYYDDVVSGLKAHAADKLQDFQKWQSDGLEVMERAASLFRVMCLEENQIWNKALAMRKAADGTSQLVVDKDLLRTVYGGANNYERKWFVFNRPYVFGRQAVNDPVLYEPKDRRAPALQPRVPKLDAAGRKQDSRATGRFLLTINFSETLKARMRPILLADRHIRAARVSDAIVRGSVRIKKEGGTFTLGIPPDVLAEMADLITLDDLNIGGRLTPLMKVPTLVTAEAAARRETLRIAQLDEADQSPAAPSWADIARGSNA